MNLLRRLGHWAIAPVVATGTTAGLVAGASAEPVTEVVDLSPAGGVSDALCIPLYGWGKQVGIPVIVEAADGTELTSLEGYDFQIRAADGTVLDVPPGNGSGPDDPVNISAMTANAERDRNEQLGLYVPPIFYLNCIPPGGDGTPFADGTTLVAMMDGVDVSSGSLAGRFPPTLLPFEAFDPMAFVTYTRFTAVDPCTSTGIRDAYEELSGVFGLTPLRRIATAFADYYAASKDPVVCDEFVSVLEALVAQAAVFDAPRGLLDASTTLPVAPTSDTVAWADYGFLPAVRIESLTADEEELDNEDTLPNTGAALWILAIAGGAAGLAGVAARRRSERH